MLFNYGILIISYCENFESAQLLQPQNCEIMDFDDCIAYMLLIIHVILYINRLIIRIHKKKTSRQGKNHISRLRWLLSIMSKSDKYISRIAEIAFTTRSVSSHSGFIVAILCFPRTLAWLSSSYQLFISFFSGIASAWTFAFVYTRRALIRTSPTRYQNTLSRHRVKIMHAYILRTECLAAYWSAHSRGCISTPVWAPPQRPMQRARGRRE